MSDNNAVVAIFGVTPRRGGIEGTSEIGFDMKKLSIVARITTRRASRRLLQRRRPHEAVGQIRRVLGGLWDSCSDRPSSPFRHWPSAGCRASGRLDYRRARGAVAVGG